MKRAVSLDVDKHMTHRLLQLQDLAKKIPFLAPNQQ